MDRQIAYWGGMHANLFTIDDSLDVFLTRAIEVMKESPLLLGYFFSILIAASKSENSLLGENLKRSINFQEAFAFYSELFRTHIASLDRKAYPDFELAL